MITTVEKNAYLSASSGVCQQSNSMATSLHNKYCGNRLNFSPQTSTTATMPVENAPICGENIGYSGYCHICTRDINMIFI